MRGHFLVAMVLASVAAAGCEHRLELPPHFVELRDPGSDYDFRGIAADGTVVALRTEKNPPKGTLEFWSEAVETQLVSARGYKLEAREDVTSSEGVPGKLLRLSVSHKGATFTYLVGVFVQTREVLVAEAGGKAKSVEPRLEQLKTALLSVR